MLRTWKFPELPQSTTDIPGTGPPPGLRIHPTIDDPLIITNFGRGDARPGGHQGFPPQVSIPAAGIEADGARGGRRQIEHHPAGKHQDRPHRSSPLQGLRILPLALTAGTTAQAQDPHPQYQEQKTAGAEQNDVSVSHG